MGRSTAAATFDDAGVLAVDVPVHAGHPGADFVRQQADPQRLHVIGPAGDAGFRGLQAVIRTMPVTQSGFPARGDGVFLAETG